MVAGSYSGFRFLEEVARRLFAPALDAAPYPRLVQLTIYRVEANESWRIVARMDAPPLQLNCELNDYDLHLVGGLPRPVEVQEFLRSIYPRLCEQAMEERRDRTWRERIYALQASGASPEMIEHTRWVRNREEERHRQRQWPPMISFDEARGPDLTAYTVTDRDIIRQFQQVTRVIDPPPPPEPRNMTATEVRMREHEAMARLGQRSHGMFGLLRSIAERAGFREREQPRRSIEERLSLLALNAIAMRRSVSERTDWTRAHGLLLENLSKRQREELEKTNAFSVRGSKGGRYRIHYGCQVNIEVQDRETGKALAALCFMPLGDHGDILAPGDVMVAQKIMLECDEGAALKVANRF